jgi:hypothetical protein
MFNHCQFKYGSITLSDPTWNTAYTCSHLLYMAILLE